MPKMPKIAKIGKIAKIAVLARLQNALFAVRARVSLIPGDLFLRTVSRGRVLPAVYGGLCFLRTFTMRCAGRKVGFGRKTPFLAQIGPNRPKLSHAKKENSDLSPKMRKEMFASVRTVRNFLRRVRHVSADSGLSAMCNFSAANRHASAPVSPRKVGT